MTTLADVIEAVARAVTAARDDLNRLDGVAGDGDLGITMSVAAQAVIEVAGDGTSAGDGADADALLRRMGLAIAQRAPSTGGTLLATALLAASRVGPSAESAVAGIFRRARAAQLAIEERGGAKVGDKSMLDAIYPAVQSLQRDAEDGVALDDALAHAAAAAREGAQSTRDLEPRVGRAGWLAERSRGAEDAGAHLVALAFEAAAQAVAPAEPQSGGR